MFSTRSLAGKNTLFSSFHDSTYIDGKTSKKIIDSLVSSFNRSLDKEYGPLPGPTPATRSRAKTEATGRQNHSPRRQHVDSHLGAILASPLFACDEIKPSLGTTRSPLLGVPEPLHARPADQEQSQPRKRDPMDVFDEAVSKGLMTIPRATGCLLAKRKFLEASVGQARLRDAMRDSGVSSRVVGWLSSSGAEKNLLFLDFSVRPSKTDPNTLFLNSLIPFLIAEGQGGIIWSWFSQVLHTHSRSPREANTRSMNASSLVILLIRAQWNALNEEHHIPYDMVLETDERFTAAITDGSIPGTPYTENLLFNPVYAAWKYVSYHGTMNKVPVPHPPAQLFDRFVALARPWGNSVEADMAHLDLHHPTSPSPDKAVDYISLEKSWKSCTKHRAAPSWHRHNVPRLSRVVQMGVDAINYFVRRGDTAEAAYVYSLLTHLFPDIPWRTFIPGHSEVAAPFPLPV